MNLIHHKSVHITLFKEKESLSKRSLAKQILLIFNNLTLFFFFLKVHAKIFNLPLLLSNIFIFSLKFYYKYNINFNLCFYKHYFFTYFNNFLKKIKNKSNKFNYYINLFFIKFFNKIKKINKKFNKKSFILYNFNVFLIGRNYNIYTGTIVPFYQKKLMWFIGTGLKLDGECSESIFTLNTYNSLIWSNFKKNSILKIPNFNINLKGFNIHKRLKHYYYCYLNFNHKYIKTQKKQIIINTNKLFKRFSYYSFFYKKKNNKSNNFFQIKLFVYNFFFNLFNSILIIFKSFYLFIILENKQINLFFYLLNSFFIYFKSINLFTKLLKLLNFNNFNNFVISNNFLQKIYTINILNYFFFKNFFNNQKLYFYFFSYYNKKRASSSIKLKINYLKFLNRFSLYKSINYKKKKLIMKINSLKLFKKTINFNNNLFILNKFGKKNNINKIEQKNLLKYFRRFKYFNKFRFLKKVGNIKNIKNINKFNILTKFKRLLKKKKRKKKFKNRLKKKYLKYFKKIFFLFLHKNKKNINKKNINKKNINKKNINKKNINKKNINNLKKLNKKSIYLLNKLDKGYFNIIYCNNYSKYINFKFIQLKYFNKIYFFKIFNVISFFLKLKYFFINVFIKKYEFFFYYKNFNNFIDVLKELSKFLSSFIKRRFNFFLIYKTIYEKLLLIDLYLKQFFFNLIKLKKNCFKYKYFFFNLIKYLIILKKKYLYFSTLNIFSKYLTFKFLLSEKFNKNLIGLYNLKKKNIYNLKTIINKQKVYKLLKKKTKKYLNYILYLKRNSTKLKKKLKKNIL